MERNSQTERPRDSRFIVEGQLRECFARVVYSHKAHEKCADILLSRLTHIKLIQIALSSLSTVGFIMAVVGPGKEASIAGIVVSATSLCLNLYSKENNLGELAQKHRQTASELWLCREEYLALITDLRTGTSSLEKLTSRRDTLLAKLGAVYAAAPSTTARGYRKAQVALKKGQELTFTDTEIDSFLPAELRRTPSAPGASDS